MLGLYLLAGPTTVLLASEPTNLLGLLQSCWLGRLILAHSGQLATESAGMLNNGEKINKMGKPKIIAAKKM